MENKWNIIARNFRRSKEKNVSEDTYQDTIEHQLQLLGWYNGIENKVPIQVGASRSLIPDMILSKDSHKVLVIEIKKPNNTLKERQASQLLSYMRQLKLPIGLYIGENIKIYYDAPDDESDAICVYTVEFEDNSSSGRKFCQLLEYENFNLTQLEEFCAEQVRLINARNDFKKRIKEYVSPQNVYSNIIELLKDKFISEGFDDSVIFAEFKNLNINISFEQLNPNESKDDKSKYTTIHQKITKQYPTPNNVKTNLEFYIKNKKGVNAKALYIENGKVRVLAGSEFASKQQSSFTEHIVLAEVEKVVELKSDNIYRLLVDFDFSTPSQASKVMTGASTNGWIAWKTTDGKTLDEVVRKK